MLDVGWTEILVIAIVLIVVVGPKDLPHMLRQFGRTTAKMRAMAGDFRKQFDEALKEAELDDVRDLANQARGLDPRQTIRKHLSPLEKAGQDIKAGLDEAMKPKPKVDSSAEPASAATHTAEPVKAGAVEKAKPVSKSGAGKSGKAASMKRASVKASAAKPASARRTSAKSNGSGSAETSGAGTAAPAKRAAKSPSAKTKSKPASGVARKTRAASAARQDKSGSAT